MPRVGLHLSESDHKVMVRLVANGGVRREVNLIMDSDGVVEEVAAGEREVLKDEFCILVTRDRNIADLHFTSISNISLHNNAKHTLSTTMAKKKHLPNILLQIWLKLQAPLAIKQRIPRQPRPIVPNR